MKKAAVLLITLLILTSLILVINDRRVRNLGAERAIMARLLNENSVLWRTNKTQWAQRASEFATAVKFPNTGLVNEFGQRVEYVHSLLGFEWVKTLEISHPLSDESVWWFYEGGRMGRTNRVWYQWNDLVPRGTNGR